MNSDYTTLQVPLSKALKKNATLAARELGFSSLQGFVRMMLFKLTKGELTVSITEAPIRLSRKASEEL